MCAEIKFFLLMTMVLVTNGCQKANRQAALIPSEPAEVSIPLPNRAVEEAQSTHVILPAQVTYSGSGA